MLPNSETNSESESPTRSWWLALTVILVAAAWLRICNLGTFSLWLDEVFTMVRSTLSMPELLAESAADAENVPLYLIVTHICLGLGMTDPWLRLVPILAGLGSILLWAWWCRIQFGARISLLTAGFMALSTFHVRYSQELRAYPYLLLITGFTMLAADRLRTRPKRSATLILAVAIGVGWYTHLAFAWILIPMVGLVLSVDPSEESEATGGKKRTHYLAAAIALGTLAFLPWFVIIATTLQSRMSRGATILTPSVVGRRWEFMTIAANEAVPLSWAGAVLAGLAIVGIVVAIRFRIGRAVLLPSASVVILSEVLYQIVNRWSKARYITTIWPFLVILMVLGLERILAPVRKPWIRAAVYGTVAVVLLIHVDAYHRTGRPHWDRMAEAVAEVRRLDEPVMTESEWVSNGIDYYLDGSVTPLRWEIAPVHAALERAPSVLLVTTAYRPDNPELRQLARRGVLIARIPETGVLHRLRPDMLQPPGADEDTTWPTPATALVSARLEAPVLSCVGRLFAAPQPAQPTGEENPARIDLAESANDKMLRGGWSPPGFLHNGIPVRWALGPEAAVILARAEASAATVAVRLKTTPILAPRQSVRILLNGQELGTHPLTSRLTTVRFDAPQSAWRPGSNLLVLQFSRLPEPAGEPSSPRAAAIKWIEIADS